MYNSIKSEIELAKPIISYLEEHGWSVYQEVFINGRIADIVATFGKLTYIIECKTSLSLKLLEQIYGWRGYANYISIAIPIKSNFCSGFVETFLIKEGIGAFTVDKYSEVYKKIEPKLNRKVIDISKFIKPEHKFWAEAGSQKGYYTPFQNTKRNIEYNIKKYPNGILFKDFLKLIEYHYRTESTARSCLRKWIDSGVIKGIKIVNQGNKLFVYPNIDNHK
mgnify:FL=1